MAKKKSGLEEYLENIRSGLQSFDRTVNNVNNPKPKPYNPQKPAAKRGGAGPGAGTVAAIRKREGQARAAAHRSTLDRPEYNSVAMPKAQKPYKKKKTQGLSGPN